VNLPKNIEVLIKNDLIKILPKLRLAIVKGFFEDALDEHLPGGLKASLVHIDCDLYSSAKYVLEKLIEKELLQDGCVSMFDDFNCNMASPYYGERLALCEILGAKESKYFYSELFSYGWHGRAFFIHEKC